MHVSMSSRLTLYYSVTQRRKECGERNVNAVISNWSDKLLRNYLVEAASVVLSKIQRGS
jgi:transposase